MKDLPHDKHGRKFLKVPFAWNDLEGNEEPGMLGRLIMRAGAYAFDDEEPDRESMSEQEWKNWLIAKRDIDYQCRHHRCRKFHNRPENQESRFTTEYKLWRDAVYARDEYTCQYCGQVGGKLNAHHILPYASYPELRTSIENGVTLCVKCHKAVHRGEIQCPAGY